MKVKAVISKKPMIRLDTKTADKNTQQLHILTGVIAFGILFGVMIFLLKRAVFTQQIRISYCTEPDIEAMQKQLLGYLAADTLFFLCLLLCGSSVVGIYPIYPILFLKASGLGALACTFIQNEPQQSVGTYYTSVFPGKCLLILVMLMMGQNCLYTSDRIKKQILQQGSENNRLLSLYLTRGCVVYILLILSDIINAVIPWASGRSFLISI